MNGKLNFLTVIFIFVIITCISCTPATDNQSDKYNVLNYGAVGNGKTLNTDAINNAISDCSESGGGTVTFPPGVYVSGTIVLKSNVTLNIDNGAVIMGSGNIEDYGAGGLMRALIVANDAENIAITGRGVIDGNGYAFMDMNQVKVVEPDAADYDTQFTRQGEKYMSPEFGTEDGPVLPNRRPHPTLEINNCRNFLLTGITIKNTPAWAIRLIDSEYADFIGFKIINDPLIPNNDGIHCTSSRIVHISDFHFEGGDDAIIVTGFGDPNKTAENVTVTNCTLKSKSAGVRVGYGDSNIRNCVFENLVIYGSNRGLGVFLRDSGSIENILFSNITIKTRMYKGHWWGNAEPIHVSVAPQTAETKLGHMKNIRFSDIVAESENGIVVHGWESSIIEDVVFDNVKLRITNSPINDTYGGNFDLRPTHVMEKALFAHDIPGLYCTLTDGIRINDFTLEWEDNIHRFFSHGIECEDFKNLVIDGFTGRQAHLSGSTPVITLANGATATIRNCFAAENAGTFLQLSNVAGQRLFVNNDLTNAKKAFEPGKPAFTLSGNLGIK
ncbi:glycoside hydrolase family 28 protein [Candidatus Latescibacterota bacterium]